MSEKGWRGLSYSSPPFVEMVNAPPPGDRLTAKNRWLALYVLCLGDLMIVLDQSIVNVALPSIQYRPRLLADVAGVGRQRLPADLRRLPAAVRPARRPARQPRVFLGGVVSFTRRLRRLRPGADVGAPRRRPRGPGAGRRGGLRGRAVADHGPVHRARRAGQGDGRLRLRDVRRRRRRRPARRRAHRALLVALDLPGQRPGRRRRRASPPRRAARRRGRRAARPARRPRRRAGHRRADARRSTASSAATRRAGPRLAPSACWRAVVLLVAFVLRESRVADPLVPLRLFRLRNVVGLAGRRRAVGRRDVRLVLPGRALPPAGAGLRRARGRPRLRADQPGDGGLLAAALRPAGDALRHPRRRWSSAWPWPRRQPGAVRPWRRSTAAS